MKKTLLIMVCVLIVVVINILSNTLVNNNGNLIRNIKDKSQVTISTNIYNDPETLKLIGHRGASSYAPENTIPSYLVAARLGFWGGECDIMCTKDGAWILMHDNTVDRTTNGSGNVYDFTLEQIKKLKIDYGSNIKMYPNLKVPTLEEYLQTCKENNLVAVIDIKESVLNNFYTFIETIRREKMGDKCIVISASIRALEEVRKLDNNINMELIINHSITQKDIDNVNNIARCGIDTKRPTKVGIDLAHKNGVKVNCWVINSIEEVKKLKKIGVDAITSDVIHKIN